MKIDELFAAMAKHNASDLHIRVGEPPVFRISGDLVRLKSPPISAEDAIALLTPILSDRAKGEFERLGYADFSYQLDAVGRFRCNVYKQLGKVSAAIRRVKPGVPSYTDLGLPSQVARCAQYEQGLILIGGITGSGKSTTIAAILNDINSKRRCHILTIEDPVEYVFADDKAIVNQREVGVDVATFDDALRSAVRQDPDVMLLGEMRDATTVETALTAAETGHLVFGTIHASGSAQTIGRILDLFPEDKHAQVRTALAFNLKVVLNQKLLAGTEKGRMVPVVEIMFASPLVRKLILDREDAKIAEAVNKELDQGSESYNRALSRLHKEGKIAMDAALAASPNPEELRMLMRGITISDGGIV